MTAGATAKQCGLQFLAACCKKNMARALVDFIAIDMRKMFKVELLQLSNVFSSETVLIA